jgi:S-adenosylhomocysteine hydrolase
MFRYQSTPLYLRSLPLLEYTSSLFSNVDLNDTYILCAQHLVSTSYSLFYKLIELGLKPFNLAAIGKCYSTDHSAIIEMKKLGIDICDSSSTFDSHLSFDEQYKNNIKNFVQKRIKKLKNNLFKQIIVLDDGGDLLIEVNSIIKNDSRIIGIEQTSSGFHKIKDIEPRFPIINLARSPAKLFHESPIIAKLVIDSLTLNIQNLDLKSGKALIIGNGPIGSHIHHLLAPDHKVTIYDKISSKSEITKEEFYKRLGEFDIIIGSTGTPILDLKDFELLKPNALLVSTSSSDREFNAYILRRKIPKVQNCHQHLKIEEKWLINCGFPVNFSSNFRLIDPDELQLTRALLLAAILQCSLEDPTQKGFIPLDLETQNEILKEYYSLFPSDSSQYLIQQSLVDQAIK